ncbi:hypothetical protein KVR01_007105 [Diaporthe batatas]|uniref:uncharacterized protein n=1 Tax=Diaporthe batatas TaxID=748121 RepID=UPI001D045599|nr:uncharacterized protein KVR01_007105 [Diaporthe batatas]KAG8162627.1 hypothetical protein KVR01_007105 [Diaporthe batatas]
MSPKPTFVLVPGAWHRPSCFDKLRDSLSKHGYPSVAVTTPSVGSEPPVTSMAPDVDAVEAAVRKVLDRGDDVYLLMHSYGGAPGSAASGRIAESGGNSGDGKGRIKRLFYVAACVPIEGIPLGSPAEVIPGFEFEYMDVNEHGNAVLNEKALVWMYDGLPEEEQRKHLAAASTQPIAAITDKVAHVGWRYIPSTSVYGDQDLPIPLRFAEFMVNRAQAEEPREGGVKAFAGELGEFHMDCGHFGMFLLDDKVEELVQILDAAVKKS